MLSSSHTDQPFAYGVAKRGGSMSLIPASVQDLLLLTFLSADQDFNKVRFSFRSQGKS